MKAVLIFSGGLDSTTLLYRMLDMGYEVEALTFNYAQRHKKEIECAEAIAERLNVAHKIVDLSSLAELLGKSAGTSEKLITFVKDRPGHDRRYAINCDKLKKELGWKQSVNFEQGLDLTVRWYLDNEEWIRNVQSGEYKKWMEKNYGGRN